MNKHNIVIILYFMSLSLFFINTVNAQIINGDFEDGGTGWTFGGTPQYSMWVCGSGNSSAGVCISTWQSGTAYFYQDVDFTGMNELIYDMETGDYTRNYHLRVYIGSTLVKAWSYDPYGHHVWFRDNIDVSGFTGVHRLKFYTGGDTSGEVTVDNVEFIIPDCEIHFSPNVDETETFPLTVNLSVNDSCTGLNQVRVYRNNNYIYYYQLGSTKITSILMFELIQPTQNCTYKVELLTLPCGIVATDTINYIFNDSIDPFPTPVPIPIITPLPTYTPPPTPIPPEQPNVDNGSLNMTWLTGYFNLVDASTNGLFHPIYNMTAYLMMPVNILSSTLSGFMGHTENAFDIATIEILTATSLLNLFFGAIPDKILNVMTYYLVWIVILLIAKGDT